MCTTVYSGKRRFIPTFHGIILSYKKRVVNTISGDVSKDVATKHVQINKKVLYFPKTWTWSSASSSDFENRLSRCSKWVGASASSICFNSLSAPCTFSALWNPLSTNWNNTPAAYWVNPICFSCGWMGVFLWHITTDRITMCDPVMYHSGNN